MQFFTVVAGAALLLTPHAAAMYSKNSPVLQVDHKSWNDLIANSHMPSIVEFYAPWCVHCKNLKPAYEKAAESLQGIAQVAAVNCDEERNKAFCGRMGVQGFPTLKTVSNTGTSGKPIIHDYRGERSAKGIADAIKALLPNFVDRIGDKDLDKWLADKPDTPKAVLFSDKGKTPALLKSIAGEFRGNLVVAMIRDTETGAAAEFGISDYPTLVVVPKGASPDDAVTFEGELDRANMVAFLSNYAEPAKRKAPAKDADSKEDKAKNSKASKSHEKAASSHAQSQASEAARSAASETVDDPDAESPAPTMDDEPKPVQVTNAPEPLSGLATPAELQDKCLGPKTGTCVLALLPPTEGDEDEPADAHTALVSLTELSHKMKQANKHNFPFYVVHVENELASTLRKSLGLAEDSIEIIAVNGKRKWWRHYDLEKGAEIQNIEDWVDAIKLGDAKKEALPVELLGEGEEKVERHDEL